MNSVIQTVAFALHDHKDDTSVYISKNISEIYAFIPINRKKQEISETVSRSTPAHQEETAYGKKKEQEETKREVSGNI